MTSDREREQGVRATLDIASQPEFWDDFDKDAYASLEFLENEVAPEVSDADLLHIRYVGTDLDLFKTAFDRLEIVDGTDGAQRPPRFSDVQALLRGFPQAQDRAAAG